MARFFLVLAMVVFIGGMSLVPPSESRLEKLTPEDWADLSRLMEDNELLGAIIGAALVEEVVGAVWGRPFLGEMPRFTNPDIRMEYADAVRDEEINDIELIRKLHGIMVQELLDEALSPQEIEVIEESTGIDEVLEGLPDRAGGDAFPAGAAPANTVFVTPKTTTGKRPPRNPCSTGPPPLPVKKRSLTLAGTIQYFSSHAQLKQYGRFAKNYVETPNFAIFFDPLAFGNRLGTEPEYVTRLRGHLEFAHQRAQELGMTVPETHRDTRITVTLVPSDFIKTGKASAYADVHAWQWARRHFHIVLPMDLDEKTLREFTAHEVFHIFQFRPDMEPRRRAEIRWILDGTATSVEDEMNAVLPGSTIGFPAWRKPFLEQWIDEGRSFSGLRNDFDYGPENNPLWYGSSILFKWWAENLDDGPCLIPALFKGKTTSHARSRNALVQEIERRGPGDFPENLLKAGISAYLLDGPAPYRLKRGAAIKPKLPEFSGTWLPVTNDSSVTKAYDAGSGAIERHEAELEVWAAHQIGIKAAENEPAPLHFAADHGADRDLRVALIETSRRFAGTGHKRVTPLDLENGGKGAFVVPRVASGAKGDDTTRVEIFAVNGSLDGRGTLKWSMGVGGPPFLKKAEVWVESDRLVYQGEWQEPNLPDDIMTRDTYREAAARTLRKSKEGISEKLENLGDLKDVRVRLTFSKPVVVETVKLGKTTLESSQGRHAERKWWFKAQEVEPDDGAEGGRKVNLEVDAQDVDGAKLDADPATPAVLRRDGTGWRNYEDETGADTGLGGFDDGHHFGGESCKRHKAEDVPRMPMVSIEDPAYRREKQRFEEELLAWQMDRFSGRTGVELAIVEGWMAKYASDSPGSKIQGLQAIETIICMTGERGEEVENFVKTRSVANRPEYVQLIDDMPEEISDLLPGWFVDWALGR